MRKNRPKTLTKKEREILARLVRWSVSNYIDFDLGKDTWKRILEKLETKS